MHKSRLSQPLCGLRRVLCLALPALLCLFGHSAMAAPDESPHSDATLVAENTSIEPGKPFTVALHMTMEKHWHNYWINPGDSGLTTKINWTLPAGWKAGPIQWPYPSQLITLPLVSYGYENEVWLLTEITPAADSAPGNATLKAQASWLICSDSCIPAKASISLQLPMKAGAPQPDPRWQKNFAQTRASLPVPAKEAGYAVSFEPASGKLTAKSPLKLRVIPPAGVTLNATTLKGAYFFVDTSATLEHAAPQPVKADGGGFSLTLTPSEYATAAPKQMRGVLLAPAGKFWDKAGKVRALWLDAPVAAQASATGPAVAGAAGTAESSTSLGAALLLAFGGGLLLNLMPCVFPVLSLKILGFVKQSGEDRGKVRRHGFAFGAGVLASFWVLSGVLLALRAAGSQSGWGYQLQSPAFVGCLCVLMFGIALNLLGVFEVGVGLTRLSGKAGSESYGSSFGSGVLATVVATPCTAPFMGAALGYALTQSTPVALLVFTALGLGVATPYVLLSMNPAWLKKLPRPGAWMESLKQLMAFPMFATGLWLVWVFGKQTGIDGITLLLGALLLAGMAVWMLRRWGNAVSRAGRVSARFAAAASLVAALGAGWFAAGSGETTQDQWQPFSSSRLAELQSSGKPVFVDFTAAWCTVCQINKKVALNRPAVQDAFARRGVTLMEADWTKYDPEITDVIQGFGRAGVPVYALYKPSVNGAKDAPVLLPEGILTESAVLDALKTLPETNPASPVRQASRPAGEETP